MAVMARCARTLFPAEGLTPDKDYKVVFSGKHENSIMGVNAGDYDAAKHAFDTALRQRPNDVAARDGMNQVEQRSTLSDIEQYHQKAIHAEADEHHRRLCRAIQFRARAERRVLPDVKWRFPSAAHERELDLVEPAGAEPELHAIPHMLQGFRRRLPLKSVHIHVPRAPESADPRAHV